MLSSGMNNFELDLAGPWSLIDDQKKHAIQGNLPGNIHLDLLSHNIIPDPFLFDNERKVQWVSDRDWSYSRDFELSKDDPLLSAETYLDMTEVDTLATLFINGKELASFNNFHRRWKVDVGEHLVAGQNTIKLDFASPVNFVKEKAAKQHLPEWCGPLEIKGRGHLRKAACNFGWDWGPVVTTSGVLGHIKLRKDHGPEIADYYLKQDHADEDLVVLSIEGVCKELPDGFAVSCRFLDPDGTTVFDHQITSTSENQEPQTTNHKPNENSFSVSIPSPRLWWCKGLGDPDLYELRLSILDSKGKTVDEKNQKVGIRKIRLVTEKDTWGESFHFEINDVPIFAKGANWIPGDAIFNRMTELDYASLLNSSVDANMNMIRIWGGGYYEKEIFYDLCDELGLLVWQDFMYGCSAYPCNDPDFLENAKIEAEEQIVRLRNRTCLALWCGNNELEQGLVGKGWTKEHMSWEDYDKLYNGILANATAALDPETNYWPASPHTPHGQRDDFNNPTMGDAHLWDVWHGKQPFEWYRTADHRFCAEFGFQSFPEPKVVNAFTKPEDREINSPVMELHQRSPVGNSLIMKYMKDWFRDPKDFDQALWLSQLLQALAIKYAVEHWRRNRPRSMGTLYWQLNDCWPVASWSSIDYHHNWKALHFAAKKFYAPILISVVEDPRALTMDIHISNDSRDSFEGRFHWSLETCSGELLSEGKEVVLIRELSSSPVTLIDLTESVSGMEKDVIFFVTLEDIEGQIISENCSSFVKPKDLSLADPGLSFDIQSDKEDGSYLLSIKAKRPSPWVWLSTSHDQTLFSDNFFAMKSNETRQILVESSEHSGVHLNEMIHLHSISQDYF